MGKKYNWHIIAWSIYILYQFTEVFIEERGFPFQSVALTASYTLTTIFTFYVFYFIIWKPYLKSENKIRLLSTLIIGPIAFIAFRYILEENIYEAVFGFGNYRNDHLPYYIFDNISRAIFVGSMSLIVALLEHKYDLERDFLQLKNEKSEAEMAFLRSQMNPHFLFNTLSFLHTKTFKFDPDLAETVRKLSDMLRYSLQSSKAEKVPIQKEIDLLENYIDIFRNRFEGKFFTNFNVKGNQLQQKMEPLLLMPFIENAFKHGVMNKPDTPVQIELEVKNNALSFICKNKINHHQKDPGSGIGLENVKRRLELLYPNKHQLDIQKQDNDFIVSLQLDLK